MESKAQDKVTNNKYAKELAGINNFRVSFLEKVGLDEN